MKKILAALLSVMMLLVLFGCAAKEEPAPEKMSFKASYMDYFDTLSTIVGYAETQEEFDAVCEVIKKELEEYHMLYDIYHKYTDINNLYIVNKEAANGPVVVDEKIIDLFEFSREMYDLTGGKTNYAMV